MIRERREFCAGADCLRIDFPGTWIVTADEEGELKDGDGDETMVNPA